MQAAVTQSEASVNQSQVNRDHTVILAPIDGIVTQRSVDVGQTVAASMQAPTLFVIAADLTEMQVNANIDEADVGRIRPGQHVTFRVDAYPTDNFVGTVTQIRLQPVVVQNVTTYGTVITVPEPRAQAEAGHDRQREDRNREAHQRAARPERGAAIPADRGDLRRAQQDAAARGDGGLRVAGVAAAAAAAAAGDRTPTAAGAEQPAPQAHGRAVRLRSVRTASASARATHRASRGEAPTASRPRRRRWRRAAAADSRGGGGRGGPEFQARMLERFKTMSPDEQQQFIARMKERGGDTSRVRSGDGAGARRTRGQRAAAAQAQTIDALFAPLPPVESRGRAWLLSTNS